MSNNRFHRVLEYIACLLVSFITLGIGMAFGTFLPHILDRYGESRSTSSAVYSVFVGVAMVTGVFSGSLIKKVGTSVTLFIGASCLASGFIVSYFATKLTVLFATFGVVSGIGGSFSYVSGVVSTGRLFDDRHRTVFLSIQNAVGGVGGVVLPYLIDWLVNLYGLNGAFLVIGGIFLNLIICAIVLHYSNWKQTPPIKQVETDHEQGRKSYSGKISLTSATFVSLLLCTTIEMSNIFGISAVIMDIFNFKRISHSEGLMCFVIYNLSNSIFRFLPVVTNFCSNNPLFTLPVATTIGLLGSLTLLLFTSLTPIAFGTAAIGASDGATMVSLSVIVFKLVIPESQAFGYGLLLTTLGATSIGFGPLYGGIYDLTNSYSPVLIVSSSMYMVSLMLSVMSIVTYRRLQNKTPIEKTTEGNSIEIHA